MSRSFSFVAALSLVAGITGAQPLIKTGDLFPDVILRPLLNAPLKQLDVRLQNRTFLILNFWGTWCSPCLPEMDSLARLQRVNRTKIQVIAVSDETPDRLRNYLQRKPSGLWLASDTSGNLYRQFGFNYVGQAAILNPQNRVVALVRTDSINQALIDRLIRGESLAGSAETGERRDVGIDPFGIDSTLTFQFTWGGYRKDLPSMAKNYFKTAFEGRRRSYFNVCPATMYQDAYGVSHHQLVYEGPEKSFCDWGNKHLLYCVDLLVRPEQKDSFPVILRETLNRVLPVKARLARKVLPVYILRRLPGAPGWSMAAKGENSYGFSGKGFHGEGIPIKPFADYVANEMRRPVIDETGLTGRYNILTENVVRTEDDMLAALKKLGLTLEKADREMDVVVLSRP